MEQGSHLMTYFCSRKLVIFYSDFDFRFPKFIHLQTQKAGVAQW